jgi:adenylate cyclase class 2
LSNYTETEVKLYVPDLAAVAKRLEAVGAKLTAPRVHEVNARYDDADETLNRERKVLRLRRDTRIRLTYKDEGGERTASNALSRYEAEVEVSDFDTMHTILENLGYRPYMIYEKFRTTYELDGAEVTLDEMPYGSFVEIEGDEDAIGRALERLNLQDAPRMAAGYAMLFENVKRHLGLDIQDLTFANFEGVDVPQRAFASPDS